MQYLVTGGAGFIGSHLCDALLQAGHAVTVLDNLSSGKRSNLADEVNLVTADCADRRLLPELIAKADGVFHLAAIASVTVSIEQWSDTSRVNQFATIALLEAISQRQGGAIPFVYASSAAVYGNPDPANLPLPESAPTCPLTPYGADKLGSELHAHLARSLFNIPSLGMRFFNVYGPRQDPSSPYSGVISIFMDRLRAGLPITIFGDGTQSRDFMHVSDVVARLAQAMALLHHSQPAPRALNVCTGHATSLNQLAHIAGDVCTTTPVISYQPARAGDIKHSTGDASLLNTTLGEHDCQTLTQGLQSLNP